MYPQMNHGKKGKKTELVQGGFQMVLKCTRGITAKVVGMAPLQGGGQTVKKCMFEHIQMEQDTVRKQLGVLMVHQFNYPKNLLFPR